MPTQALSISMRRRANYQTRRVETTRDETGEHLAQKTMPWRHFLSQRTKIVPTKIEDSLIGRLFIRLCSLEGLNCWHKCEKRGVKMFAEKKRAARNIAVDGQVLIEKGRRTFCCGRNNRQLCLFVLTRSRAEEKCKKKTSRVKARQSERRGNESRTRRSPLAARTSSLRTTARERIFSK